MSNKQERRRPGGITPQFPRSLHTMLSLAEEDGYSDVVAWRQDGKSFLIHDRKKFVKEVMPLYFQQTKFSSFRRQLNIYGFECIDEPGADFDGYYHAKFQRDKPELVESMKRFKNKSPPRSRSPKPTPTESNEGKPSASCSSQPDAQEPAMALYNSLLLQHSLQEASDYQDAEPTPLRPSLPFAPTSAESMEGQSASRAETDRKISASTVPNPSSRDRDGTFTTESQGEQPDCAPSISLRSNFPEQSHLHQEDEDSKTGSQDVPLGFDSAMRSGDLGAAPSFESLNQEPPNADDSNPYAKVLGNSELRSALTDAEDLVWSTERMLGSLPVARQNTENVVNEDVPVQAIRMHNSASTMGTIDLWSSNRTVGSVFDPHHSTHTMGTIDFYESSRTIGSSSTEESNFTQ